jgi:hypothetical protein
MILPMDFPRKNSKKIVEEQNTVDPDYYIVQGKVIFTAAYHLKRGYCCKNGCRHCPYGYKTKP